MPSGIPHDWLVAEAEAWPLSSEAAFDLSTVALRQANVGFLDEPTKDLADTLEAWLRPRAGGLTLEVLRQIREKAWFGDEQRQVSLAGYTISLAQRYLEQRGNHLRLKEEEGMGAAERAARWRRLAYLLPQDLLTAAMAAVDPGREPLGEQVHLLTPHLERILNERPVAETHLHVGAAVPFHILWTSLCATLADDPPQVGLVHKDPFLPFGGGEPLVQHLLAAVIWRLLLAEFLRRSESGYRGDFTEFCLPEDAPLRQIAGQLGGEGFGELAGYRQTLAALAVQRGAPPPALPELLSLYRRLLGPRPAWRPWSVPQELADRDPLAAWLGSSPRLAYPETRFTARALGYLLRRGAQDGAFACTFWQYQRVRCLTFRYLVEEPGTGGLDWFSRHYQRISALRKGVDGSIYRCALESESTDVRLNALEVRTAPPKSWPEVSREVLNLAQQALGFQRKWAGGGSPTLHGPEVGLILHFIKEREDSSGKRLHADPRRGLGCRYGAWYCQNLQRAQAVVTAIEKDPEILLLLRGLDIANAELAIPTWVSLPLFAKIRKAGAKAAEELARKRSDWQVGPLRVTCHLGEDFVRLAQGLRRIHEPIEFGLLTTGSRIGHAVALGLDPAAWGEAHGTMPQTAEERLEDLLWELERYARSDLPVDTGRLEYVRHEAVRLSRGIYRASPNLDNLLEARRRLHSPRQLEMIDFPYVRRPPPPPDRREKDKAFKWLWRYLTDGGVFERGQEKVEVRADEREVAFLRCAQRWLRSVLGRLEITVECNPSSNLLIGDLHSLEDHPAFRLNPLPSTGVPEGPPVLLSVNVDDPITFASNLADEFAHIYFALTRRGVSSQEALDWLDHAREHGWRSRFTLEASSRCENLWALIRKLDPRRQEERFP